MPDYGAGARMVIKGLAPGATKDDYQSYFSQFGNITDVYIPGRGVICFVTYESDASLEAALAKPDGHVIKGHTLDGVERAAPRASREQGKGGYGGGGYAGGGYGGGGYGANMYGGAMGGGMGYGGGYPQPSYGGGGYGGGYGGSKGGKGGKGRSDGPDSRDMARVFVKELPPQASDQDLKDHFSQFGEVADVYIPRDVATGNTKGIAFVRYNDEKSLAEALVNTEVRIAGAIVSLSRAEPRVRDSMGNNMLGYSAAGQQPAYGMPQASQGQPKGEDEDRIMCRDLPANASDQAVRAYWEHHGTVVDCYMPKDHSTGGSRGFAYIKFADPAVVSRIMATEQHLMDGQVLNVIRAAARNKVGRGPAAPPKYVAQEQQQMVQMGMAAGYQQAMMGGGMMGMAAAPYMMQAAPAVAPSDKISVGGIAPGIGSHMVRAQFMEFGQVLDVYFPGGEANGGTCYVRFATAQMADDAVARSRRDIAGHPISEIRIADAAAGVNTGAVPAMAVPQMGMQQMASPMDAYAMQAGSAGAMRGSNPSTSRYMPY